jgi:hypothetical protein
MDKMTQEIARQGFNIDPFAPIDQYCERTAQGLLGEPLNLVTNLSFIIAGLSILKFVKKNPHIQQRPGSQLLPVLMITIGLGSALFHSLANLWSMWADIIPIGVFVLTYLWLFLRHEAKVSPLASIMLFVSFFLLSFVCSKLADGQAANGGEAYFGTWITLFGISCYYGGRGDPRKFLVVGSAALTFSLSLFFRTVDMRLCDQWSMGTHLLWHVFNGVVLFLVTKAYLENTGPVLKSHPLGVGSGP